MDDSDDDSATVVPEESEASSLGEVEEEETGDSEELSETVFDTALEKHQRHICHIFPVACAHKKALWRGSYPEILRTCRYLRSEGAPLLPKNKTVQVAYHFKDDEEAKVRCRVAGQSSVRDALGMFPALRDVQHWSVNIYLDLKHGDLDLDMFFSKSLYRWDLAINADISAMRKLKSMKTLEIDVVIMDEGTIHEDEHRYAYYRFFCNPFRVLHVQDCHVETGDDCIGKHVTADIRRGKPTYDLQKVRNKVSNIVDEAFLEKEGLCWIGCDFRDAEEFHGYRYWRLGGLQLPPFPEQEQFVDALRFVHLEFEMFNFDFVKAPMLEALKHLQHYMMIVADLAAKHKAETDKEERYHDGASSEHWECIRRRHRAARWVAKVAEWRKESTNFKKFTRSSEYQVVIVPRSNHPHSERDTQ